MVMAAMVVARIMAAETQLNNASLQSSQKGGNILHKFNHKKKGRIVY